MTDPALISQFNTLKGLILQVKKGTDTLVESLPTVDFCCDMFDRADESVLGGYWGNGREHWALRGRRALPQTTMKFSQSIQSANHLSNNINLSPNITIPPLSFYRSSSDAYIPDVGDESLHSMYLAEMSQSDLIIKLGFDLTIPRREDVVTPLSIGTTFFTGFRGVASSIGGGFADAGGRVLGASGYFYYVNDIHIPSNTFFDLPANAGYIYSPITMESYSLPGNFVADMRWRSSVQILSDISRTARILNRIFYPARNALTGEVVHAQAAYVDINYPSDDEPMSLSGNTFTLVATGNTYEVFMNGASVFRKTTKILLERTRVVLLSDVFDAVTVLDQLGLDFKGLTFFKAWPVGMPEPPDQTGHGRYTSDGFNYADRYHDSEGNYNPEA